MKILVLTGSPRKNGNSNALADAFIEGAREAGNEVVRFDAATKNVRPCFACEYCKKHDGICAIKDDFALVRDDLLTADAIVFVSPIYYFNLSAQLKATIDRFYGIDGALQKPKKTALILTLADNSLQTAAPSVATFEAIADYLGWQKVGRVVAQGVWNAGDVAATEYPKQARELGKKFK